jgi:hypothetical protein
MSINAKRINILTAAQYCSVYFMTVDGVRIIGAEFAADRLSTNPEY